MSKKISLITSLVMTSVLFFLIIFACFALPTVVDRIGSDRNYTFFYVSLYTSALPGLICDVSLLFLLLNIKKNQIFTSANVRLLRIISWCCIFVGLEYFVFGHSFISLLLCSFAALFFGLILHIIKNVFEKAIELREENDFTI